ncbi:MAG: peptidoglycan DD-metalloendopeptidase family protein [Candidatus Paceibacterota bacterium]
MQSKSVLKVSFYVLLSIVISLVFFISASAQNANDLINKIEERGSLIQKLEEEIERQQREITLVQKEKMSLQNTVQTLELSERKLENDIRLTEVKINQSNDTIEKLNFEIGFKLADIYKAETALTESIVKINEADNYSIIELLLQYDTLSDFWSGFDSISQFQAKLSENLSSLRFFKDDLESKKAQLIASKNQLSSLRGELGGQKEAVLYTKSEKSSLLEQTENKESEYQKILNEKIAQKARFERELQEFEAQLKFILDPTSIPTPGTTVFRWPLASIRITQLFGNSEFAKKNPSIYGGRAYHPGVDLAAPIGTKLSAPLSGVVSGTGNTDAKKGCYSWGKWILITHPNGLSTLYAHLSSINVKTGETVSTGDTIGYTGNTGFSTGPHLHFTVYATEGVDIVPFESIRTTTACGGLTTPAAATSAYLDPLDYLPKI